MLQQENNTRQISTGDPVVIEISRKDSHQIYVLKEVINSGGFGVVYNAHFQSKTNGGRKTTVAVKTVDIRDADDKENAFREAIIQRDLRIIPNVIHLIDFFIRGGKAFFVQELAAGGDLLDRLLEKKQRRYQEKDAKELARTLVSTIRDLHRQGIAHRDLKPENVLLKEKNDDTQIMLCDFGDAARLPYEQDEKFYTCCGTPAFMAPEVNRGNGYREEADMWSIGCILFMLLGGYAPFGYDRKIAYQRATHSDYSFERSPWNTEVSMNAKEIISNLLIVDPVNRWTASEALNCCWLTPTKTQKKLSSSLSFPLSSKITNSLKEGGRIQQRRDLFLNQRNPGVLSSFSHKRI